MEIFSLRGPQDLMQSSLCLYDFERHSDLQWQEGASGPGRQNREIWYMVSILIIIMKPEGNHILMIQWGILDSHSWRKKRVWGELEMQIPILMTWTRTRYQMLLWRPLRRDLEKRIWRKWYGGTRGMLIEWVDKWVEQGGGPNDCEEIWRILAYEGDFWSFTVLLPLFCTIKQQKKMLV